MLNSIIIGGDTEAGAYLRQVCADFADICIYKVLNRNVRLHEVILALNNYGPDVVFLDVTDLDDEGSSASFYLQELSAKHPQIAVVPFSRRPRMAGSPDMPSLGPALTSPYSAEQLEHAVRGALRLCRSASKRESTLIAFLPSKPGAGATTVALHVASAAALVHAKKTLLVEADFRSGSLSYRLGLQVETPAGEAMDTNRLNDAQWGRCIDSSRGFDILPAGGGQHPMYGSRWDYFRLLRFARERYDVVVVDLPEGIDDFSESIIAESDRFVMVCTPEMASLSMVRRRMREMESVGVSHSRMQLAVNRYSAGDGEPISMGQIAKRNVSVLLPDDPHAIKCANRRCGLVASNSLFWRTVVPFTGELLGTDQADGVWSVFGFARRMMSSLFGTPAPDSLQTATRTRGGRSW